jgi:hypothetical protein
LGRSSGGAFNGGTISAHNQTTTLDPLTLQSLICKQGENKHRGTIHSNLIHTSRGLILAMEGHGEEEEEDLKDNSK